MKPSEKIKEIRESEKLSQAIFGAKFGVKDYTIGFIEQEKQDISDDLALKLEAEYNIPFKWWKTSEGAMSLDNEQKLKQEYPNLYNALKEIDLTEDEIIKILENYSKVQTKQAFDLLIKASQGDKNAISKLHKYLDNLEILFDE